MGRGGTNSLWSSGMTCNAVRLPVGTTNNAIWKKIDLIGVGCDVYARQTQDKQSKLGYTVRSGFCKLSCSQCYRDKPYGQLVSVSLTHYCASTPDLSTSWSRTTLQGAQGSGKSHLKASFPLRCFQRLSLPNLATRQCHWRDNRYTRGSSTPVLSY